MRKALIPCLVLIVLMASCQSSQTGGADGIPDSRARMILVQAERNALIWTEGNAFADMSSFPIPASWDNYIEDLPQIRALRDEYMQELSAVLTLALPSVTDRMMEELDSMDLSDVHGYIDAGLSSLTDELRTASESWTRGLFAGYLAGHGEALDKVFSRLEMEAGIWQKNLDNLSLVGQGRQLEPPEEVTDAQIATWAADLYFDQLAEHEVMERRILLAQEEG